MNWPKTRIRRGFFAGDKSIDRRDCFSLRIKNGIFHAKNRK
jgi:hypothetical protein